MRHIPCRFDQTPLWEYSCYEKRYIYFFGDCDWFFCIAILEFEFYVRVGAYFAMRGCFVFI